MSWNIRTDLAIETREFYKKAEKIEDEIPGVKTDIEIGRASCRERV